MRTADPTEGGGTLDLTAPISGVLVPLDDVPDEAFAQRLVGDGVSIDPISDVLLAPCPGTVSFIHPSRHALTVTTPAGVDILLHIGLDTVALRGEGFTVLVGQGQTVERGQELIRFDLPLVAARAASLLTQMVVTNQEAIKGVLPAAGLVTAGRDRAAIVALTTVTDATEDPAGPRTQSGELVVRNPIGLHARPAAVLTTLARQFPGDIQVITAKGRADAKSLTSIMMLGVGCGDTIRIAASGPAAREAVEQLSAAVRSGLGESIEFQRQLTEKG